MYQKERPLGVPIVREGQGRAFQTITYYRECTRIFHSPGRGPYFHDGCQSFRPSGAEGTFEGVMCAHCNCNKAFHRKVMVSVEVTATPEPQAHGAAGAAHQAGRLCTPTPYNSATRGATGRGRPAGRSQRGEGSSPRCCSCNIW